MGRPEPVRGGDGPDRRLLVAGLAGLALLVVLGIAFTMWSGGDGDDREVSLPSTSASAVTAPSTTAAGSTDASSGGRPARADLQALCAGSLPGVTPAGDYPGTLGPPHVLAVASPTGVDDGANIGDDALDSSWLDIWQPNAERPVELVFCQTVERGPGTTDCGLYEGTPVRLQDANWQADIRVAATGEVLASASWPGVTDCPLQVFVPVGGGEITSIRKPDPAAVRAFAEPWVMG
jgi:hypothetical protein